MGWASRRVGGSITQPELWAGARARQSRFILAEMKTDVFFGARTITHITWSRRAWKTFPTRGLSHEFWDATGGQCELLQFGVLAGLSYIYEYVSKVIISSKNCDCSAKVSLDWDTCFRERSPIRRCLN